MIVIIILTVLIFYSLHFLISKSKIANLYLLDNDFKKVQSFHKNPVLRSGGILIFSSIIFIFIFFFNKNININHIILFSLINFFVGFAADIKLTNNPIKRFLIIVILNLFLILYFEFYILNFNFFIFDYLNSIAPFKILLVFFAIFFIINGSNLIDGFNGLLSIHTSILFLFLLFILKNNNFDIELEKYLIFLIFVNILFLTLNFPNAKIFLGDAGAYFLGSNAAVISILISNNIDQVSPFFIANVLFYIFYEIFFSVFRKIAQKKNPFYPDKMHLHMMVYRYLKKKMNNANPLTSIFINGIYFLTMIPCLFYYDNTMICQIIFIFQLLIYMSFYFYFLKKN